MQPTCVELNFLVLQKKKEDRGRDVAARREARTVQETGDREAGNTAEYTPSTEQPATLQRRHTAIMRHRPPTRQLM
ncbi:hypothetical protein CesoFtcFv8_017680 [Champsocephalus esox]|uniref:Uncharacterized protein n=1 Tax=Champsocephalus esox TaxID=159716 RepID=A0AAN8BL64_9TELE|nr:hypothetical protein CesoFtcFv8_017680 [Champsocephalus esox]